MNSCPQPQHAPADFGSPARQRIWGCHKTTAHTFGNKIMVVLHVRLVWPSLQVRDTSACWRVVFLPRHSWIHYVVRSPSFLHGSSSTSGSPCFGNAVEHMLAVHAAAQLLQGRPRPWCSLHCRLLHFAVPAAANPRVQACPGYHAPAHNIAQLMMKSGLLDAQCI